MDASGHDVVSCGRYWAAVSARNPGYFTIRGSDTFKRFPQLSLKDSCAYAVVEKNCSVVCKYTKHPERLLSLNETQSPFVNIHRLDLTPGRADEEFAKFLDGSQETSLRRYKLTRSSINPLLTT